MMDLGSFGALQGQPVPLRQWEVSTRQVGKITNPLAGICFFLVTFGFYGWYWAYVNHRDLQATTGGGLGHYRGSCSGSFSPSSTSLPFLLRWMTPSRKEDFQAR